MGLLLKWGTGNEERGTGNEEWGMLKRGMLKKYLRLSAVLKGGPYWGK